MHYFAPLMRYSDLLAKNRKFGEDLVILVAPLLTDPPVWQTDEQTDGQNCDG